MRRTGVTSLTALALFLPGAAMAQFTICGQSPQDVTPLVDADGVVDAATMSGTFQQLVEFEGGTVYFQFEVTEVTNTRIEASDDLGSDPVLELLDSDGAVIALDDDGGGGLASRIETMLQPGTYCAAVRAFGAGDGQSMLQLGRFEHEPLTPGLGFFSGGGSAQCGPDTPADAVSAGPLDVVLRDTGAVSFSRTGSPTYHRFELGSPMALTLTATNSVADPVLWLFDGAGIEIGYNDDFDGLDSQIDMVEPLAAGTYCIGVTALSDPEQPIEVRIVEFDPAAQAIVAFDRGEAAPPLDGSYPVESLGALRGNLSRDLTVAGTARWASFELSEASMVLIEVISNGSFDPMLALFNERGELLVRNDDYGDNLDPLVAHELMPGRYLVAVINFDSSGSSSGTGRLWLQRYTRAQ